MVFSLEGLRGVAALLVTLFHGWSSTVTGGSIFRNGWLAVDLFFVISGFVMSLVYRNEIQSKQQLASFAIKRFGRLYPLHLTMLVLFIACEYTLQLAKLAMTLAGRTVGNNPVQLDLINLPSLVSHLLLTNGLGLNNGRAYNAPSWSISVEFWTYLVFGLVLVLFAKASRWRQLSAWGALSLIGLYGCLNSGHDSLAIIGGSSWFRCLYGFFAGALLPLIKIPLPSNRLKLSSIQIASAIATITLITYADRLPQITFFAPLVFCSLVYSLSTDAGLVANWLKLPPIQFLGRLSYSMYMTHFSVLVFFNPVGAALHEPYRSALKLPFVGIMLGLSWITYRYVEIPWREKFRKISRST